MPELGKTGSWLGLGGLPRILRGLNAAFQFVSANPAELDHKLVWKLVAQFRFVLEPTLRALREAGRPVGDATVLAVHEALRRDVVGAGPLEPLDEGNGALTCPSISCTSSRCFSFAWRTKTRSQPLVDFSLTPMMPRKM